jgi:hypothetical protein
MNKRNITKSFLSIIFTIVSLSFSQSVFSQANAVVDAANPRHETINQRVIAVLFDANIQAIPLPSANGWSVTVNGIPAIGITVLSVNRPNGKYSV